MNLEVILSPTLYPHRILRDNHITVAVDILRATTSICAAFAAGAEEVVPLNSLDPLPSYHQQGYLVAAERGGYKMPLAEAGNSPTEYLSMNLQGRRLAYSTTNGTVSVLAAKEARHVLVGAFSNLSALARKIVALSQAESLDVVVLCSGWKGDPSLEDTLFAGALVHRLQPHGFLPLNDAAFMSLDLWSMAQPNLRAYVQKATHVARLEGLGASPDIDFAFQLDTCPIVPYLNGDKLVKTQGGELKSPEGQ